MIALTVEQMKVLRDKGLDCNNASMYYLINHPMESSVPFVKTIGWTNIPEECLFNTFTLEDILKILPNWIEKCHYHLTFDSKNRPRYYITRNGYFECWVCNVELEESDSALDAAYKLLIWCLDNKYIK